jgi:hypothetical protein
MSGKTTPYVDGSLGRSEITLLVKNSLDDFVLSCLNSDFDIIVPIQEEGLAILLPKLKIRRGKGPEIIPSNSLRHIDKDQLDGKSILIVEAAVRSGGEIKEVTKYIEENFNIKSTSIAAFLVLEGYRNISDLEIPGFHVLSPNQYLWAKDVIVEHLLDEVFVHFADPPMWEFAINSNERHKLLHSLIQSEHAYVIPELNKDDDWIRISINDIVLNDRDWLIDEIEIQPLHKIRILIHKQKNVIKVLPLFYPKVLVDSNIHVSTIVKYAKKMFPKEFEKIIKLSEEVKPSPYNTFRWVATIGSMLLLRDFSFLCPGLNLNFGDMKLDTPIPNLYQYSCSDTILNALQEVARSLTKLLSKENQYFLFKTVFGFNNTNVNEKTTRALGAPFEINTPEEGLVFAFSKWINRVSTESLYDSNVILDKGISLEEVYEYTPYMTKFAVNQSLDRLIDEGLIKLRLGKDRNNYIVRTFVPGGESIRIHLRALGKFLELNSQLAS